MAFIRPDIVRPPSEHSSYYLPLTSGCSNNTCAFCMMWDRKLQIRELPEIKQEIDALALYQTHGVRLPGMPSIVYQIANQWDGHKIFLLDESIQLINDQYHLINFFKCLYLKSL